MRWMLASQTTGRVWKRLFRRKIWQLKELGYAAVDDETTQQTMRELKELGYTSSRTLP